MLDDSCALRIPAAETYSRNRERSLRAFFADFWAMEIKLSCRQTFFSALAVAARDASSSSTRIQTRSAKAEPETETIIERSGKAVTITIRSSAV